MFVSSFSSNVQHYIMLIIQNYNINKIYWHWHTRPQISISTTQVKITIKLGAISFH